ncbi:EF-hand domain-containing protein [Streptomyces sp. NPDC003691]
MQENRAKEMVFAVLDTDRDGVISRDDYFTRIDRVTAATGRRETDPLVALARETGERAWSLMDADGDGLITRDEYVAWAGVDVFDGTCSAALGALFDLADGDGDGAVSRAEFVVLRTALGSSAVSAGAAFDALDTDHDGRVGRDEYLSAIRAHLAGEQSPAGALYLGAGDPATAGA